MITRILLACFLLTLSMPGKAFFDDSRYCGFLKAYPDLALYTLRTLDGKFLIDSQTEIAVGRVRYLKGLVNKGERYDKNVFVCAEGEIEILREDKLLRFIFVERLSNGRLIDKDRPLDSIDPDL